MSDTPRVTVLVPTYNNGTTLERCLTTLAAQDYPNFHVVIVDDCSKDGSAEIARQIARNHPAIRLLVNERNLGAVENFINCRRYIEGEYFMFGGPDDSWNPRYLSAVIGKLQADPSASAAISSVNSLYDDGESEIYRFPEVETEYANRPLRLIVAFLKGRRRDGSWRSPYNSWIHAVFRSRDFDALFTPDRTFWFVEMHIVMMATLLGNLRTVPEVLYTRHRSRLGWTERNGTDSLMYHSVRPLARMNSALHFLAHAAGRRELSVHAKFKVPAAFMAVLGLSVARPLVSNFLKQHLPETTLRRVQSILYRLYQD